MGSVVTGENLFVRSPVETIQKAVGPPLYMVPTQAHTRSNINRSEQLAAAAKAAGANVTTWFPENGEHVQTPTVSPQEFERRLVGFFREALGE